MTGRHAVALDQVREDQRRDFRHIVGMPRQLRQGHPDFPQPRDKRLIPTRFDERRQGARHGGHELQVVFLKPLQGERQDLLL